MPRFLGRELSEWGMSQARNAKRESGTRGQGKYGGRERRARIVFRPTVCDSLIPGVTQFVCVTKHAKHLSQTL